jgi:hypothetical protein
MHRTARRANGTGCGIPDFLLILALAAFAAAWYYTGGDLTALPQRLQSLGADSLPHAGAKLI